MKRFAVIMVFACLFAIQAFSQGMEEGTGFLSVGIGPSNSYISYRTSASPALRLSYDKGVKQIGPGVLTVGGMVGGFSRSYSSVYFDHKYLQNYHYNWRWTYFIAAARLGYFYNFADLDIDEMNIYGGFSLGPRISIFKETYDGPADGTYPAYSNSNFGFHFGSYLGLNYFITPKMAIYSEFGYDISWFTLGVTFNM